MSQTAHIKLHPLLWALSIFGGLMLIGAIQEHFAAKSTPSHTTTVSMAALPPYLAGTTLGSSGAPALYTRAQLAAIIALYHGKLDGPERFQNHCGKANYQYIAGAGPWRNATALMYSSNQAGHNPSGTRNDILVFIDTTSNMPHWLGSTYTPNDTSKWAIKAYLYRPGTTSHDENGYAPGRTALDAGRLIAVLGCRP